MKVSVPALKTALEQYGRWPWDHVQDRLIVHTHENGFQEPVAFNDACNAALDRIEALEIETLKWFALKRAMKDRGMHDMYRYLIGDELE